MGGETFTVEDNRFIPARGWLVEPATILSYLSFSPGDQLTETQLQRKVDSSARRLKESGLFYAVHVGIIPPRKNPESRTIMIKAVPGFYWRFNGGAIFAGAGRKAINGGRNFLGAYAGYNLAGTFFTAENVFQKNIVLGGALLYQNNQPSDEDFQQKGEVRFFTGWRFHPDIEVRINISEYWAIDPACQPYFAVQPEIRYNRYFGRDGHLVVRTGWGQFITDSQQYYSEFFGDVQIQSSLFIPSDLLCLKGSFRLPLRTPFKSEKPSLHNEFRGPLPNALYRTESFYVINAEYGLDVFSFFPNSMSPMAIHPFVFCDAAQAVPYGENLWEETPYVTFGPGLKLIVDSPIFITAVLTCGFNIEGEYIFQFNVKGDL